jgi:hypothetical protein
MQGLEQVESAFNVINNNLFHVVSDPLDYSDLTTAIRILSNRVNTFTGDSDDLWSIGEFGMCCLPDMLTGAFWHFTEYHQGQYSDGYATLSALGEVFTPNMSMPELDNDVYIALNELAEKTI